MGSPRRPFDLLLLAAAALALYAPSLSNGLTNWDDDEYIVHSRIAVQGVAGIPDAFSTSFGGAWYPLTHATYALIHQFAGDSPAPYHAVQWVLFALCAALVPLCLRTFGASDAVGFWAGLLWVAHPLRVESVVWAANLKDTLSLFFVLLAFALLGMSKRIGAVAAWTAALLAKSTVFPLAIVAWLLEGRSFKRAAPWGVPAAVAAFVAARLHLGTAEAAFRSFPGGSVTSGIASALWLPWLYLGRLLWPSHPQAVYDFDGVQLGDLRFFAALLLWAGWLALVFTRKQRSPWILGTACWALPFIPVTGLVPLAFHVADRYTLLPSLALATGLLIAIEQFAPRAVLAVAVAALALAAVTTRRVPEWKSSLTLWEADKDRSNNCAVSVNLAGEYGGKSRFDDAATQLRRARSQCPQRLDVLSHLVFALLARDEVPVERLGQYLQSIDSSEKAPEKLSVVAEIAASEGHAEVAQELNAAIREWSPKK